jgi:hypothetical protein
MSVPGALREAMASLNTAPSSYREAWPFAAVVAAPVSGSALAHFLLGSSFWPVAVALLPAVVLAVTLGTALRVTDRRGVALSGGLGAAYGLTAAAVPAARETLLAAGPAAVLFAWLLALCALLGYTAPEYAD